LFVCCLFVVQPEITPPAFLTMGRGDSCNGTTSDCEDTPTSSNDTGGCGHCTGCGSRSVKFSRN